MKSLDEENQKLISAIETARNATWNKFITSKGNDIEIPPFALDILKLAFEYGYGEGISFMSAYMTRIVLEEQLQYMMGKSDPNTKSKSFGVVPPIPKENLN
jgi:hypothetical protein